MLTIVMTLALAAGPATLPPAPYALAQFDHENDRRGDKHRDKEERKEWKRRGKEEDEYWKHERKWEKHRFHDRDDHDDDRWDFDHPRHRHPAPPWMDSWWRPDERRYCAVDPRDPSRVFIFVGGRWVPRRVYDPRFRADISGALSLPMAPPPVPLPPHFGVDLHVVLFN